MADGGAGWAQAGADVLGAGAGYAAGVQENRAAGRQAAQMDPFIDALVSLGENIGTGGEYGGLRGAAARELAASSNALTASMGARGISNSGYAMQQQNAVTSDVFSNLAQAINADQLTRQQIQLGALGQGAQFIQGTQGYGFYDRETGQSTGK